MKTRVLIVDDEADFLELITFALEANGFECSVASNGVDGLALARRATPDAMILDIMLPDLDGFTICEMLRLQPSTSRIAVVMLTCLGGTLSRLNGIDSGADDYLTKPFQTRTLLERLRLAIQRRVNLESV